MMYSIIRPASKTDRITSEAVLDQVRSNLQESGWTILRGFDVDLSGFSALTQALCKTITFDPAREYGDQNTQKVDAGTGPIGLHIENGNTPVCPDVVAFYSPIAAFEGSQTTICDGREVYAALPEELRTRWARPMTVSRYLPEELWKRYLSNEHPAISDPSEVTMQHVEEFRAAVPGQDIELTEDGGINYRLTVDPIRSSVISGGAGFANAVLGPSTNYAPPSYSFGADDPVGADELEALREIAETCTHEINWQDHDIAVIDNTRVMHGRRAIVDNNRKLFIGMGRL